ncbi:MAG: molybdenum cofactor guanylyltransferase [Bacillota bacterium]|nr:molybdenum cofactor guanylyltransferase [Bacillota bacterium]
MKIDTAIILAGGKSSRMGFDKQLIKIKDQLIVDYLASQLKAHFSQIVVVTKTQDLYVDKGYTLTQDIYENAGPLAGIHAGLLETKGQAAYVMACDMPYINDAYITYIKKVFQKEKPAGLVAEIDGLVEPMAGIYSKNLLGAIEENLKNKDLKIKKLIEDQDFIKIKKEKLLSLDKDLKLFQNYNYKADLEKLKDLKRG